MYRGIVVHNKSADEHWTTTDARCNGGVRTTPSSYSNANLITHVCEYSTITILGCCYSSPQGQGRGPLQPRWDNKVPVRPVKKLLAERSTMYQGRREEKKRENKVVARARISPTENMLGQGLLDGAGSMLLGLFSVLVCRHHHQQQQDPQARGLRTVTISPRVWNHGRSTNKRLYFHFSMFPRGLRSLRKTPGHERHCETSSYRLLVIQ